jgi:hypothetical protein
VEATISVKADSSHLLLDWVLYQAFSSRNVSLTGKTLSKAIGAAAQASLNMAIGEAREAFSSVLKKLELILPEGTPISATTFPIVSFQVETKNLAVFEKFQSAPKGRILLFPPKS